MKYGFKATQSDAMAIQTFATNVADCSWGKWMTTENTIQKIEALINRPDLLHTPPEVVRRKFASAKGLSDLKPFYGKVFEELLQGGCTHWGWVDWDVLAGDLRAAIPQAQLWEYDAVTLPGATLGFAWAGQLSVFQNTAELRELYRVVGDHVALGFKCCATEGNKEAGQSGWEERVFLREVLRRRPRLRIGFNMAAQYDYKALMLSSVFSAAPAGNGLHSYRLAESIFLGAIPVIVDEKLVLPFCSVLDWSRFSVRVKRAQVPELPAILRAIPPAKVAAMQRRLAEVKERYFLYPFSTALALVRLRAARLRNATT